MICFECCISSNIFWSDGFLFDFFENEPILSRIVYMKSRMVQNYTLRLNVVKALFHVYEGSISSPLIF